MSPREFDSILREFEAAMGTDFKAEQKNAWYLRLKDISEAEFRRIIEALIGSCEGLPYRWNLIAVVRSMERRQGKPGTFPTPPLDDDHWRKGVDAARMINKRLGKVARIGPADLPSKKEKNGTSVI